jgi:hypothetical protein
MLPIRGLTLTKEEEEHPASPFEVYFGKKARISRFCVFGCPIVAKAYLKTGKSGKKLDDKNIIQRGVRGIFLGFPINQAGYLYFNPATREYNTSVDVSFDEYFHSPLPYPDQLYHGAMPTRNPLHKMLNGNPSMLEYTGDPQVLPDPSSPNEPWTPYTIFTPPSTVPIQTVDPATYDTLLRDSVPLPEEESEEEEYTEKPFETDIEDEVQSMEEDSYEPPRRSRRLLGLGTYRQSLRLKGIAPQIAHLATSAQVPLQDIHVALASSTVFHSIPTDPDEEDFLQFALNILTDTLPPLGESGTDPLPFLPEPKCLRDILRLPEDIRNAWLKSFIIEVTGLILKNKCFEISEVDPGKRAVPIMEIFKCKIDKDGRIDKLKTRLVFRGDLHKPTEDIDSWNPHATWTSLRFFLSMCARYGIFPAQIDFVMAYVQTPMRERVFVRFPPGFAPFVPENIRQYFGPTLLLKKALYGYQHSGKFLWEDQSEFLETQGLTSLTGMPSLWINHLPNQGIHIVLQYSDDFLSACTNEEHHNNFKKTMESRFDIEWQPRADWYLQARIQQDKHGNIYLDQQRYSKAVVKRYLPNSSLIPSEEDKTRFASPLPSNMVFNPSDRSPDIAAVKALEFKYGFRPIEAIASLNFLANTAFEELFAIRKLCSYMSMPGEVHFQALLHLLHHIRCHPPNALCYYKDVTTSPLYGLLQSAKLHDVNPMLVTISDSSWSDCEDKRSTGSYLILCQGGIIDHSTFVPNPIALSSAEAEIYAMTVAAMATNHIRQVFCEAIFGDPDRPYSVPLLTDSKSGIFITQNNRDTKRTRHIERRWLFIRQCRQQSYIIVFFLAGDAYNVADLGTKNCSTPANQFKLSIVEVPVTDYPIKDQALIARGC